MQHGVVQREMPCERDLLLVGSAARRRGDGTCRVCASRTGVMVEGVSCSDDGAYSSGSAASRSVSRILKKAARTAHEGHDEMAMRSTHGGVRIFAQMVMS